MQRRVLLMLVALAVLPSGLLAGAAERDPSMPPPLIGENHDVTTAPRKTPVADKAEFQVVTWQTRRLGM